MRRHLYNKLLENGKNDCLFLKTVWGLIKLIESCCSTSVNSTVDIIVNSEAKEELFGLNSFVGRYNWITELAGINRVIVLTLYLSWFLLFWEIHFFPMWFLPLLKNPLLPHYFSCLMYFWYQHPLLRTY